MAATVTRKRRQPSPAKAAALEARKTEIQAAADATDRDAPDFHAFLARWGDRYSLSNLLRLWVQFPTATALHKFEGWRTLGRQVKRGEKAILLQQPRVSYDETRATPDNPKGEKFHGASWMALFDFSQTEPIGEYTEPEPPATGGDPSLADEVKRLRKEALAVHPENGGTLDAFTAAAWMRYEAALERMLGRKVKPNQGDPQGRD